MNTKITVAGVSGTINKEMYLIQKALEQFGYIVEVKNNYTSEYLAVTDESLNEAKEYNSNVVQLEAVHFPWGVRI